MSHLDVAKVLSNLEKRMPRVVANVHDHKEITPRLFKVITTFNTMKARHEELLAAISTCLGNLGTPIEGSFRVIASAGMPCAVGFVVANRVVRDYNEQAESANYRVMAANILMDKADESLWELRQVGNDKYLTRQSEEDLAELIVMAKTRNVNVPSLRHIASSPVGNNEFVAYVSAAHEDMRYGYVVASEDQKVTVQPTEGESEEVHSEQIVESAFMKDADKEIREAVGAAANPSDKSTMEDYYRKMFSYAPEYFRELKAIIDSHSVT